MTKQLDITAARGIQRRLEQPAPIPELEELERAVKDHWSFVQTQHLTDNEVAGFVEFFLDVGYLVKLKPYGPKFSTPFGYSIFDLRDGEGFSIQLHEEEKIEAFHVLDVGPNGFALVCSQDSWAEHEATTLAAWEAGRPLDSPIVHRPEPGDVIVIDDLNTVHTVVGCVVEEFATTSNDAVLRLHDQNQGRSVPLPATNPRPVDTLTRVGEIAPLRRLDPAAGWSATDLEPGSSGQGINIIDEPAMGLVGRNISVAAAASHAYGVDAHSVHTIAVLAGSIELRVGGASFELQVGDTTAVPPNRAYQLQSNHGARVAVTEASVTIAFADLR